MKALVLNTLGRGFDFEDVHVAAPMRREVLVNVQAYFEFRGLRPRGASQA